MLVAGTPVVSNDEGCLLLAEVNVQSPGSRGWRRTQIVYVIRNDRLTEHRVDLGPRDAFSAAQFRVPGGVVDDATGRFHVLHTVGELRDIADFQRNGFLPAPHVEPTDVVGQWHDLIDRRRKARRNQSTFGPHGHHQRGG